MKKLKERWNIKSDWQLIIIFIVFAITGSSAAKIAGPITEWLGVSNEMGWYLYWPIRIILIFPIYQILLVIFGWLFGQFKFFWNFEKKMLRHLGLGFLIKN
jgi:cellulose synthase/poly-beta-1,6-N-acetylglucosamine synthase-like glycosyltransferase